MAQSTDGGSEKSEGFDAEYGSEDEEEGEDGNEDADDGYAFEKEGEKKGKKERSAGVIDLEGKEGQGGIFDKGTSDSEVEEYMEGLENDEMEVDGLKLPSDAEDDGDLDGDDDEDGPGLFGDYDDEEDFGKGIRDDYGGEDGGDQSGDEEDK